MDLCLNDLESYKDGTMMTHDTHVMMYETDVILKEGHHEFKGHRIAATPGANFTSLKSKFVNALVSNIRKRYIL